MFFALCDCPFCQKDGLFFVAQSLGGPLVEVHDGTTASGDAALFGFAGLPAKNLADLSRDGVIRAAMVAGAWRDRLSLAGSETITAEPGYLAGTVEASRRVALALSKRRAISGARTIGEG